MIDEPGADGMLAAAIDDAVAAGKEAAAKLAADLEAAFARSDRQRDELWSHASQAEVGERATEVAGEYLRATAALRAHATELLARQGAMLNTFNIAFFGRTGAGKSSLMEALSRGTGVAISPAGASDWTVDVRQVAWHSCVLHDIPGINGWGRDRSRAELEDVARGAVETADLVVLAFDTQSQQVGEFRKIAEWVERYGKPAVAVLNCRNPLWRFEPRVPSTRNRRQLSKAVQQHVTNIADNLARDGLEQIPIVAIHTKRAVFASAQEPYEGPDAITFRAHRETHGVEALRAWSNLPALEQLILAALREDAATIRLGMLNAQLRGALTSAIDDLEVSEERAAAFLGDLERTIENVLSIVGYPNDNQTEARRGAWSALRKVAGSCPGPKTSADALRRLEELRGGPFDVPAEGDATRLARHLLGAKLGPLREDSINRAMGAVEQAMARREVLSAEELKTEAFDEDAINEAVKAIVQDVGAYLEERVGRVIADAQDDLRARVVLEQDVQGDAGGGERSVGRVLGVSAIGGTATAVLGSIALTNFWNPAGWTAAGALFVTLAGTVLSSVFGIISTKARRAAEQKRQAARSQARGYARKQITIAYGDLEKRIAEHCGLLASEAGRTALEQPVQVAAVLHRVRHAASDTQATFQDVLADLPEPGAARSALQRAARRVEQERGLRRPAELWLGEDWLKTAGDHEEARSSALVDVQPDATLEPRLEALWQRIVSSSARTAGRRWLRGAEDQLMADPDARAVLAPLVELADGDRPQLVVCGDYSAGKSSLIKRLLVEDFRRVPESLKIEAGPATATVQRYGWSSATLVDTPGLQSGHAEHDDLAGTALDAAAALVYVFNPNLVVGRSEILELALVGEHAKRRAPKAPRTLFVINRADELGIDPEDDPQGYEQLCRSKRAELVEALRKRGIEADEDAVVCLASDPYGIVADAEDPQPEDFARARGWDGVQEFVAAARAHRTAFAETGVDVALLEAGAARLTAVVGRLAAEASAIEAQHDQLQRLVRDLRTAVRRAKALDADSRTRLLHILQDHVGQLWQDIADADGAERAVLIERLERWTEDDELQVEVEAWFERTVQDVERWSLQTAAAVDRRLDAAAFVHAFPDRSAVADLEHLKATRRRGGAAKHLKKGVDALGADRTLVLNAGHRLGIKFKSWGPTKASAKFAKAGAAIGVLQLGWELWSLVRDERAVGQREARQRAAEDELGRQLIEFAHLFADGDDANSGPLGVLAARAAEVAASGDTRQAEARALRLEGRSLGERAASIDEVAAAAWSELGHESTEVGSEQVG